MAVTQRDPAAIHIVYQYMAVSAAAAWIPVAGLDVAALAGVHVALIKRLCDHYRVDFSEHTARNLVLAIVASVLPAAVGSILGRKFLGLLPRSAGIVGWVLMSASSAAFSYGLGRLFIYHFESGGTLLNFDVKRLHDAVRHIFSEPAASPAPAP